MIVKLQTLWRCVCSSSPGISACLVLVLRCCNLVCVLIGVITTFYKYQPPHLQPLIARRPGVDILSSSQFLLDPKINTVSKMSLFIPQDIFLHKIKKLTGHNIHPWLLSDYKLHCPVREGTAADQQSGTVEEGGWATQIIDTSCTCMHGTDVTLRHCTVKHHTDIINFACMTWNFVRISASLSALCTNINQIWHWHCNWHCKILPHFDVRTISVVQKL